MEAAGYPVGLIGIIMTAYYAGLALGSVYGKQVILRVGHIRAFAVFAAVTAATALAYPLAFAAVAWLLLRLVNGFCIAGLTATVESWLNERSSNGTRGRVLGLYMVTHYLAVASGQLLVNLGDITRPDLFMLAAGLIGLSLVPVALTRLGAPPLDGYRSLSIRELYAASPAGVVGAGVAGLLVGSFYALGVVFARKIGLSVSEASLFMSMVVLGGFSFQWPIGMLADRHDRRLVLSGGCGGRLLALAGEPDRVRTPAARASRAGSLVRRGDQQRLPDLRRTDLRPARAQALRRGGRAAPAVLCGRGDGWPLAHVNDHGRAGPVLSKPSWQSPSPASSPIASAGGRRCLRTNRKRSWRYPARR